MPQYRRSHTQGGTFFFTVDLADRQSDLLVREIDKLRANVRRVKMAAPFIIDAWVVLPEHMHCIWTLPDDDTDFPGRWHLIKMGFSKSLPMHQSPNARGERGIWQHRYWEHQIRDARDYRAHMDYTHFNPVKHGLAEHPADWPFSSFARCVASGMYDAAWGVNPDLNGAMRVGERG
jgi:putative transposase